MQLPPESVLAAWPTPNYINPEQRGHGKLVLNVFFYILLMIFIGLRLFTRTRLRKVFGADDVFILLALIPTTAYFIISILPDTHFLWRRHIYDIPISLIPAGLKLILAIEAIFALACMLTKLSMLMLVRRILASATLIWRRVTKFAIGIVVLQGIIFCLTVIFQCRPPQDYWKLTTEPQPNCHNEMSTLLVAGILNTLTDFIVVLLPIRTIWTLQLAPKHLIPLIFLFGLGFISCGAGIIRNYYTYQVFQDYDHIWASYPMWITASFELYIGIICASLPATKPFFSSYLPSLFGTLPSTSFHTRHSTSFHSHNSPRTSQRMSTINMTRIDSSIGDEELLDFEKGLRIGMGIVVGRRVRRLL
ncbi:integral membrane protein [Halenospora varia]|nr:integral membrane protein [Halenospora varia]